MQRNTAVNCLETTGIPYFLQRVQAAQVGDLSADMVLASWENLTLVSESSGISEAELEEMISRRQAELQMNLLESWQGTRDACMYICTTLARAVL